MRLFPIVAACAALSLVQPAPAQETGARGISIELNAARDVESGCTLSFLVTNGRDADVASAVYETVLFDTEGRVDRLTLFDFGALPAGRPRVRQFTLPETPCAGIERLLVNGASTCEAAEEGACMADLTLSSRTGIEVVG